MIGRKTYKCIRYLIDKEGDTFLIRECPVLNNTGE